MSDLIINGIDHSVFDLEWAKRGGVYIVINLELKRKMFFTIAQNIIVRINTSKSLSKLANNSNLNLEIWQTGDKKINEAIDLVANDEDFDLRMATPSECAEAGIEYIEPLSRWLPIERTKNDNIEHPKHYMSHPSGIECIQITRHMGFNLGNAIKYIWRADLKNDAIEDLEKAVWYLRDEIKKRKSEVRNDD